MRELRFRVWCNINKEWEKGECFLAKNGRLIQIVGKTFIPMDKDGHIIQFYTGLNDINGKKIYEGDIIKLTRTLYTDCSKTEIKDVSVYEGVINFFQYSWCLLIPTERGYRIRNLFFTNIKNREDESDTDIFEILGNIYENPELLNF